MPILLLAAVVLLAQQNGARSSAPVQPQAKPAAPGATFGKSGAAVVFGDVVAGAGTGAVAGPYGAIVGGAVGLGVGIYTQYGDDISKWLKS
jgi:hypothetical protein